MNDHASSPISDEADRKGYLIVVEGIDGTGKSTLCTALTRTLVNRGVSCFQTREPTNGPYGRKIREIAVSGREDITLEEELRLFVEDRKEHIRQELRPHLEAGDVIVLDRYYYSTMAYQGARGADPQQILQLHRTFAPEPDLLVILELDVKSALERVKESRGSTPDAFEGADYLKKVDALFRRVEHPHLLRLDAGQSTSQLVETILTALPRRFRLG